MRGDRRDSDPGWLVSLFGAAVLVAGGFLVGLVVGVVSEEPELVVGHLAGRSEEVSWLPEPEGPALDADGLTGDEPAAPAGERRRGALGEGFAHDPVVAHEIEIELPSVAAAPADEPAALPPVAAGPPARAIASLPASGPTFAVQVGAFADAAAADRLRSDLHRSGFDVYVVSASRSGDGRTRVRVGPVGSERDAQRLADRLKRERQLPTWVLTESGSAPGSP